MRRQALTRGEQRRRKMRRRQMGTSWATLGVIAGLISAAGIAGMFARRMTDDTLDRILTGGSMKIVIIVLCLIILWQNHGLIRTWGRTIFNWARKK